MFFNSLDKFLHTNSYMLIVGLSWLGIFKVFMDNDTVFALVFFHSMHQTKQMFYVINWS
jgi:hypothetical protein